MRSPSRRWYWLWWPSSSCSDELDAWQMMSMSLLLGYWIAALAYKAAGWYLGPPI